MIKVVTGKVFSTDLRSRGIFLPVGLVRYTSLLEGSVDLTHKTIPVFFR